jgi:hypothetical protein
VGKGIDGVKGSFGEEGLARDNALGHKTIVPPSCRSCKRRRGTQQRMKVSVMRLFGIPQPNVTSSNSTREEVVGPA